jgi:septal ring factor EnvC (AmiA/AmiB activator)
MSDAAGRDGTPAEPFTRWREVILSTVLAVIACLVAVVLCGVIVWLRREYESEMRAATKTMLDQKSTIETMSATIKTMSGSHNMTRYQIEGLESSVAERDETIDGMIAKTEEMLTEKKQSAVRIACLRELIKKERYELIQAKRLAREIFAAISPSSLVEAPPELATEPKQPDEQSQKPTCDN